MVESVAARRIALGCEDCDMKRFAWSGYLRVRCEWSLLFSEPYDAKV